MSNLMIALLATLAYFICYGGNWLLGQCMIERPIIVGTVTGLFLGDLQTGIIIGGSLEAIYMGAINIGGATSAEPVSATVMATTFAITAGLSLEEAVTLAVPVGLIFNSLGIVWRLIGNLWNPWYMKLCQTGDASGVMKLQLVSWFVNYFTRSILIFLCIYLGTGAVQAVVSNLPQPILNGLNVAAGMLGAVGMALLMRMLVNKETVGWLFVGFVLAAYLKLPALPIAIIGVVIAVAIGFADKKIFDVKQALAQGGGAAVKSEEEEFFQ